VIIRTEHPGCMLRPWRGGDEEALVHHANNRKVWRNLTHVFPHPYTLADANDWLSAANSNPHSVHLAIEYCGQAVGGVGAIAGSGIAVTTAEFGYWLGESLWGRGLATATALAFRDHLIESGRFARLQALVFAWNPASMRVLEKIGFVREGVLRNSVTKDGTLIDAVMYAYSVFSAGAGMDRVGPGL
jgi:[ribosomal protein S5]-alanine N-acetyltransferase